MNRTFPSYVLAALLLLAPGPLCFADADDGFVPLFNGQDLSGWVNVNCAPDTFTVQDGMIVTTGIPTGVLRTDRQYENFILELDWKHIVPGATPACSSGATPSPRPASRSPGPRVQILDGRHDRDAHLHQPRRPVRDPRVVLRPRPAPPRRLDALPAQREPHQARRPVEPLPRRVQRRRDQAGGQRQGRLRRQPVEPRKGYICLEAEGSDATSATSASRNCPAPTPSPKRLRATDNGFKSLYTGLTSGWKAGPVRKATGGPGLDPRLRRQGPAKAVGASGPIRSSATSR